ncbi:retrovirus-related pol polyprotein from transposon TNT 1-94, partial [Tanacetum coccineum]
EQVQKDIAELDGDTFMNPSATLEFEEAESSSNYQEPSNMHESRLHIDAEMCMYALTVSTTERTNIKEAMLDHSWIESMQDELNQFKRLDVWELVPLPNGKNVIKVRWHWKNKTDAENTIIRNKSRLVAKGYSQQEGIDFEESFSPVARVTFRIFS